VTDAEIAQRAVDRGLAVWEFDEAAMKLRRERGGLISDQSALDLDNPAVAVPEKKDLWINPLHPRGPEVHSSSGQPGFGQPKPSSWMRPQTQPANGGDF